MGRKSRVVFGGGLSWRCVGWLSWNEGCQCAGVALLARYILSFSVTLPYCSGQYGT